MAKREWKMPKWMEHYRQYLGYGERVEELMSGPRATIQVNAPLALIQMDIEGQLQLLTRLHETKMLVARKSMHESNGKRMPLTWNPPMPAMCESCPFGHSKAQSHMRKSLEKGRFNAICQSVFQGHAFMCHKTTSHDDETSEWIPTERDRECAGSIRFREAANNNREEAERRASR